MTARPDLTPPGLDALLQALRAAGLPMGSREVLRLHHVFTLSPILGQNRDSKDQLRDLLASALTHDPDERELFDQIYQPWAERWTDWRRPVEKRKMADPSVPFAPLPESLDSHGNRTGQPRNIKTSIPEPLARNTRRPGRQRVFKIAALLVTVTSTLVLLLQATAPEDIGSTASNPIENHQEPLELSPDDRQDITSGEGPEDTVELPTFREPRSRNSILITTQILWMKRARVPQVFGWPLAIGALALAAVGGLLWRYRHKPWMPKVRPEPLPGPSSLPLLPQDNPGNELLEVDSAQTLIWGVSRHIGEANSSELDLEATVRRTADQGGFPQLHFARERRMREVWLWLDVGVDGNESNTLTSMELWADEVATNLSAAGLPVRIGTFDGNPSVLKWDGGQTFRPSEVEAHRQTALVAVCTDGATLVAELADDDSRDLLRILSAWPRLTFVDFSTDNDLKNALRAFSLSCIRPPELSNFFGYDSHTPTYQPKPNPGEFRAWRAALAFGRRPVDRACAWAARRELDLEITPWEFNSLHVGNNSNPEIPKHHGGTLVWKAAGWSALTDWLAEGALKEPFGIHTGSLLDRTLDFWERRIKKEAEARESRGQLDPWKERPAERHLAMELALLRLWRKPATSAQELFELATGQLRDEIRQRLQLYSPRDRRQSKDGRVSLPWRFELDLDDHTRWLLVELGLGGTTSGDMRRPGRLGLGIGLLAGLGIALILEGLSAAKEPYIGNTPAAIDSIVAEEAPGTGWIPMRFDVLKGGLLRMDSRVEEPSIRVHESPATESRVGDFWITQTQITNAQYRIWNWQHQSGENQEPAIGVTREESLLYCNSLGEEYDLPTEAEWKYAIQAGVQTGNSGDFFRFRCVRRQRDSEGIEQH